MDSCKMISMYLEMKMYQVVFQSTQGKQSNRYVVWYNINQSQVSCGYRQSTHWPATGESRGEYTIKILKDSDEFIVLSLLTLVLIASAEGREFTAKNNSMWKVLLQEIWPQFNSE